MLTRQKVILALVSNAGGSSEKIRLMKLAFLLRQDPSFAGVGTFYDFVPYKYGPFSFALYRELDALERSGYVSVQSKRVSLQPGMQADAAKRIEQLPRQDRRLASAVAQQYGRRTTDDLLRYVYERYPWYAIRSERRDLVPKNVPRLRRAPLAVYTAGYEGASIDAFLGMLLRRGVRSIADVRANAVSRKYGFARSSMSRIAGKLDIEYEHFPQLGIPSAARKELGQSVSREQLFDDYEHQFLPRRTAEIERLAEWVTRQPTVLVCMEAQPEMCHRSRLAVRVAQASELPVRHI